MPLFTGSDFSIELPEGYRDESTYALVFARRGNFRPSLVVKTERVGEGAELSVYAADQRREMREVLPGMEVLRVEAEEWEFEWGEEGKRVRQRQRFVMLRDPERVVTMTGTAAPDCFAELESVFTAAFASLRSREARD
jgi:hypothetical protein